LAITGDLGGQPIQLNGAAEEYTLSRVAQAVEVLASQSGTKIDVKSLARYHSTIKQLTGTTKQASSATSGAGAAANSAASSFASAGQKMSSVGSSMAATASAFTSGAAGAGKVVGGFSNAINALGSNLKGPLATTAKSLASVFAATAGVIAGQIDTYQKAAQAGADFGYDIAGARNAASSAGLTLDQMATAVAQSSESMSYFGGTTKGGIKSFAAINKAVMQTSLGPMSKLGIGATELTARTAEATQELLRAGYTSGQLANNTGLVNTQVMKNTKLQILMSKINGTTLQQERDKQKEMAGNKLLQASLMGMGKDARSSMKTLYATAEKMAPGLGRAVLEISQHGGAVSEASAMLLNSNPELKGAITDMVGGIKDGSVTAADAALLGSNLDPENQKRILMENSKQYASLALAGISTPYTEALGVQILGMQKATAQLNDGTFAKIKEHTAAFADQGGKMTDAMMQISTKLQTAATSLANTGTVVGETSAEHVARAATGMATAITNIAAAGGNIVASLNALADRLKAVVDGGNSTTPAPTQNQEPSTIDNLKNGFLNLFKANGGPVTKNNPYIVGELGPELFIPGSSGTVMPNSSGMNSDPLASLQLQMAAEIKNVMSSSLTNMSSQFANLNSQTAMYGGPVTEQAAMQSIDSMGALPDNVLALKPEVEEAIISLSTTAGYAVALASENSFLVVDAIERLTEAV